MAAVVMHMGLAHVCLMTKHMTITKARIEVRLFLHLEHTMLKLFVVLRFRVEIKP